jgi:mitogen-activated protein kinase kinase kinase YODA
LCSDLHIRSNISCPVSPCGSPLLRSRSPQHQNGRTSPSPISSLRTTSGASTPVTGGNGAIPLNHARQPAYRNECSTITSRGHDDHLPSRPVDPVHGRFVRSQKLSGGLPERVVSEAGVLGSQFGKMGHVNVWDLHDRSLPSEHSSRDPVKLTPSLDLTSAPKHFRHNHGH